MRSVAIKFVVQGRHGIPIRVDLVLFKQRPEEFQGLGGPDFYKNSARINRVLEKFPPARAGVIWVKTLFRGRKRPKGILLEAIAANLTETFPLTPRDINIDQRILDVTTLEADNVDGYQFLKHLLHELCDWKRSIFRDALRQDLRKLPARKRAELLEVFEDICGEQKERWTTCSWRQASWRWPFGSGPHRKGHCISIFRSSSTRSCFCSRGTLNHSLPPASRPRRVLVVFQATCSC